MSKRLATDGDPVFGDTSDVLQAAPVPPPPTTASQFLMTLKIVLMIGAVAGGLWLLDSFVMG